METATDKKATKTDAGRVAKIGNLATDLELRYSPTGKSYARGRFAVSRPLRPGDWAGERVTDFYDITAFGTLAEHAVTSLHKGDRVVVIGRGEIEHWTGKDGSPRETRRILADAVGPDLRWAEATLTKAPASESSPTPEEPAGAEIPF